MKATSYPAKGLGASPRPCSRGISSAKFTLATVPTSRFQFCEVFKYMYKALPVEEKSPALKEQGLKHAQPKARELRGEGS